MPAPSLITVSQLARRVGLADAPIIVDVCVDADFALDPRLVPGAFRHPFDRIEDLAPRLDRRTGASWATLARKAASFNAGPLPGTWTSWLGCCLDGRRTVRTGSPSVSAYPWTRR